jgi:MoaA/NifB/PqqE/SkfB family radical SAM enzyme
MTLTPYNSNWECLSHIKKIAEETGSTYSFRIAWNNNTYYNNNEINLNLSPHQKDEVAKFIEKYCLDDPFMRIQLEYLKSGNVYIMGDKKSRIHCLAGDVFVLVKPDGSIYPCINSSRKIGDFERGIFLKTIKDIGKYEQCPCCTECCVYPMINWSEFREK